MSLGVALVLVGVAVVVGSAYSLFAPLDPEDARSVVVHIPPGASTSDIAGILAEAGLVKSRLAFLVAARLAGRDTGLKAGWYELSPALSTGEILDRLARGEVATFRVTIPEGYTVAQVLARLRGEPLADPEDLEVAAEDAGLVAGLLPSESAAAGAQGGGGAAPSEGRPASPLQGYLFPDTYTFDYGVTAKDALAAMVFRFRSVWTPELAAEAARAGLTVHEVTTLASIVELETRFPEERPLVAAVFRNRLARGMPLESDVTVAYAVGKPASELTRGDFQVASPYNTYVNPGLPPGPICNPGLGAILAALRPADVPYLYFVAQPDGHLLFATTYAEHLANVRRVRRASGP